MKLLVCTTPSYTATIQWCLEDVLHLTDYNLTVKFRSLQHKGEFLPPTEISIAKNLDGFEPLRVLFHEIRHYYQFHTKMFHFDPTPFYKSSHPTHLEKYLAYKQLPWELDADEFAMETFRQYQKTPTAIFQKFNPIAH